MQSPSIRLPSELWEQHILTDLSSQIVIDSVSGTSKELTNIGTGHITREINKSLALSHLFEKEKTLDKLFRQILTFPHSIKYLDFTELQERRLYFIPISPKHTHLVCNDPISNQELERIALFAEQRKLKCLQHLLLFFSMRKFTVKHLSFLGAIFQVSQITSLSLEYLGKSVDSRFNILKILPDNLSKLVLHNAGLNIRKIEIFKSKKFECLRHLDLSFNKFLSSEALATLLEANLPHLETLILNHVGSKVFPHSKTIRQMICLNINTISLNGTFLRNPNDFIKEFKKLTALQELFFTFIENISTRTALKELQEINPILQVFTLSV